MITLKILSDTLKSACDAAEAIKESILLEYRIEVNVMLSFFSTGVASITIEKDGMEIFRSSIGLKSDLNFINEKLHKELVKQREIELLNTK